MTNATGNIFIKNARRDFFRITGDRYNAMCARLEKKKIPRMPFDKNEFRFHLLTAMNQQYDGVLQCRYCNYYFNLSEIAVDHAIPLSRGGSTDLDNIEFPCKPCNARKGSLTPTEYLSLLAFLEKEIPLGRQDVLNRLEISVQLVIGARANAGVIGDLKKAGHWQAAQAARRKNASAKL